MDIRDNKNIHKYLSVTLFVLCLMLDAFYISNTYKPQHSMALLMGGWLGLMAGYFSWLANPLYIIALFSRSDKNTITFSMLALLFSLSFLVKEKMVVSEAPTFSPIVSYGPGYFFWVLSICVLLIGGMFRSSGNMPKTIFFKLSKVIVLGCVFYSAYYFLGEKSIYHVFSERRTQFERLCKTVKEEIYKPAKDIKGIYIKHAANFYFQKISNGFHKAYGAGSITFVGYGYFDFEEGNTYFTKKYKTPYIRIYDKNPKVRIPTNNLESNYEIYSQNLAERLPKYLGIKSYRVFVKSRETNEIYAETSFVSIIDNLRICSPVDKGTYSILGFLYRALDLRNVKKR